MADNAPQAANVLATPTTAVVVPEILTMVPKQQESKNCAKKTIEETIAMSVPNPRTPPLCIASPSVETANCKIKIQSKYKLMNNIVKIYN